MLLHKRNLLLQSLMVQIQLFKFLPYLYFNKVRLNKGEEDEVGEEEEDKVGDEEVD